MRITKTLLIGAIALIMNFSLFAQNFDTTQYYGKMDWIFYNVNTTQVTTGMLRDFGIDFLDLSNYTGTGLNDSNFVGVDEWRLLYGSLYSDQINTNAHLLYLDTLNRLFNNYSSFTQPITITTLYYTYQSLVPNAVSSNLMSISNGQLFDVSGRSQSPYTNNDLFAVAPLRQAAYVGVNQLLFSSALFSAIQVKPSAAFRWTRREQATTRVFP